MCGIYKRKHGASPQQAVEHSQRFQMNPNQSADHALQASLIANYPMAGSEALVDLPWGTAGANPLSQALEQKKGWLMDTASTLRLDPDSPAPMLVRLADSLRHSKFLRLDFGSPQEVSVLASMARVLPVQQKIGSMPLRELSTTQEGLELSELRRARRLLGPVPFEVRASGLRLADLTPARVDQIIATLKGEAEVVDFNLPEGQNPPVEVVQRLANAGLACTLRIPDEAARSQWDALGVGYCGIWAK